MKTENLMTRPAIYVGMTPAQNKAYKAKWRTIGEAAREQRADEIERIACWYELESDEGGTAIEKATRIYETRRQ